MPRLAVIPLCVCLAAPLWSGCQSTGARTTARVDRSQPAAFWSADGNRSAGSLVSGSSGSAPVRLASRSGGSESSIPGLSSGTRSARIPLPRTAARTADGNSGDHQIGAF